MNQWLIAFIAALASLINVSVGTGDQRVSLGIIVLIVALYFNEDIKAIPSSIITGLAVYLVRLIVAAGKGYNMSLMAGSYLLEVLFYLGYGVLYEFLVRRDKEKYANPFILLIMICDFGGNALELIARYAIYGDSLANLTFQNLLLAAFVRSALIWIIIRVIKREEKQAK